MTIDREIPARALYEALCDTARNVLPTAARASMHWSDLSDEIKAQYARLARVAAESSPAPVVLKLEHIPRFPGQGIQKHFYVDARAASIERAVDDFREFLRERVEEHARNVF